jgi:hypothetical protein
MTRNMRPIRRRRQGTAIAIAASIRDLCSSFSILNRCTEDVNVVPVVIAELKLSNIQILFADFVERPDNAALQDRPKAFNRIGVDCANYMLTNGVINGLVRKAERPEVPN